MYRAIVGRYLAYTFTVILIISCGSKDITMKLADPLDGLKETGSELEEKKLTSVSIVSDLIGGSFQTAPDAQIDLTASFDPQIWYCINSVPAASTDYCCDPLSEGTSINADSLTASIPSADGDYCLSYQGFGNEADQTDVFQHIITVNSALPNLELSSNKVILQSTQLLSLNISSTEFGDANFELQSYVFDDAQSGDCNEIASPANFASNGLSFDYDATPDTITMNSYTGPSESFNFMGKELMIDQEVYIYTTLENTATSFNNWSCAGILVQIKDFTILDFATSGDLPLSSDGEFEYLGSFSSHMGGKTAGSDGKSTLYRGVENIIY
ncbi:MAG: hypothetical protein QF441_08345 [Bacteriovoracaceae bacterium]|nr:hypothetical protein [Bacteriovoracaceae bacterium]